MASTDLPKGNGTHQELGAALGVIVVSQVLPSNLYTPLAAEHVPQPIARHHHKLILRDQRVAVNLRIYNAHTRLQSKLIPPFYSS